VVGEIRLPGEVVLIGRFLLDPELGRTDNLGVTRNEFGQA
jgi:hypothetical protein